MSGARRVLREVPLLVWLALSAGVAWLRRARAARRWAAAKEPPSEIPAPPPCGYIVNLTTGSHRKFGLSEWSAPDR